MSGPGPQGRGVPAAVWAPAEALTAWEGNPRVNAAAIDPVARSMLRFGFGAPIVARAATGEVIAGHTRLAAFARVRGSVLDGDRWRKRRKGEAWLGFADAPGPEYTDHTVMLGLLACDLARGLCLSLDLGLLAQFSLVHDIVEVKANDTQTLVIDDAGRAAKAEREAAAKAELKEELGRCWLIETLERYERQDCPESRFVRVLDKVLPKLTHLLNGCVAAKALTDEAGFKAAHGAQAADLLRNYPDVAAEVHELLRASMEASEEMWARDTREGASQEE